MATTPRDPQPGVVRLRDSQAARRPSEIDRCLGRTIRKARRSQDITQAELARIVGVSFPQLQKYETGANRMSVAMLIRIARALGTNADAIIEVACADLATYLTLSGQAPERPTDHTAER